MDYGTAKERRWSLNPSGAKACFKCNVEKPYAEFYKHPQMADGHLGKCKACTRADSTKNYDTNLERERERRRRRGSGQTPEYRRAYYEKFPLKKQAHIATGNAIRDGKLVKGPCERCGTTERIHAHHDDYAKPLEVRWLCPKHHRQHHNGRWID